MRCQCKYDHICRADGDATFILLLTDSRRENERRPRIQNCHHCNFLTDSLVVSVESVQAELLVCWLCYKKLDAKKVNN